MRELKNILIVRTDRIGDVILTTPAIKALRKHFPKAKISILLTPTTRSLLKKNPYLDETLVDDRGGEHKGLRGFVQLVQMLKAKHFDAAVIFHTKKRTNLLCFWAGIPKRIGYKNDKFGFLLTHPIEDTRPLGAKHEAEYCLDVLKVFGIDSKYLELHVSLLEDAQEWALKFFQKQNISSQDKIVAIHPGASDPAKCWPAKRFTELIDYLADRYQTKVVLVGEGSAKEIAQEIRSLSSKVTLDLTGQTNLSQLASLFKRCSLLVSNDSGPVHIAAAVKTPVVSIFTRNQPGINPERWRPLGEKARVVSVPKDQTQSFLMAGKPDPNYIELITTQQVVEAVDALFKLC